MLTMALRKDGTCNIDDADDVIGGDVDSGDCVWDDNDDATDVDGNILTEGDVAEGTTRVFYAWIGEKDGDKFDADKADEVTASVSAKPEQESLKISSTISSNADDEYDLDDDNDTIEVGEGNGPKVDLGSVSSVTFTAQLKEDPMGGGKDVARSGVSIRVEFNQGSSYRNTHEDTLTTDDDGKVSFTVSGPDDNRRDNAQSRADTIRFVELDSGGSATDRDGDGSVYWVEETPVLTDSKLSVADYVLEGSSVSVGAVVFLYDQYGNPHRPWSGQMASITIGESTAEDSAVPNNLDDRQVISRGYARWSRKVSADDNTAVGVAYTLTAHSRNANGVLLDSAGEVIDTDSQTDGDQTTTDPEATTEDVVIYVQTSSTSDEGTSVPVVRTANSNDDTAVLVTHVIDKNNKFLADTDTDNDLPQLVFSYDSDDVFINDTGDEGVEVSMDKFESLIDNNASGVANVVTDGNRITVNVLVYDVDGSSIFEVTSIVGTGN